MARRHFVDINYASDCIDLQSTSWRREGSSWAVKVEKVTENNKETLSQRVSIQMAKVFRTWAFLIGQVIFVAVWFSGHHFFPLILSFDILQILLLTEGCCIGSVYLMNQHREHSLDRRIALNDYIVNCNIRRDVKELLKDTEKKKNFWCDGCGEPRYKCACDEQTQVRSS